MRTQIRKEQEVTLDLSVYKALYLREARSFLATLRQTLVCLQDDLTDPEALHQAHRAAHTLKGMSSTMRYEALTALGLSMEEPLAQADQAESPLLLVSEQVDALVARCDEFEAGLDRLEAAEKLAGGDQDLCPKNAD